MAKDGPSGKGRGEWEAPKPPPKTNPPPPTPPSPEFLTFEKWIRQHPTPSHNTQSSLAKVRTILGGLELVSLMFKGSKIVSLFQDSVGKNFFHVVYNFKVPDFSIVQTGFQNITADQAQLLRAELTSVDSFLHKRIVDAIDNKPFCRYGPFTVTALYQERLFWLLLKDCINNRSPIPLNFADPELRGRIGDNWPPEKPVPEKPNPTKEIPSRPNDNQRSERSGPRGRAAGEGSDFNNSPSNPTENQANRIPSSQELTFESWIAEFPEPSQVTLDGIKNIKMIINNVSLLKKILIATQLINLFEDNSKDMAITIILTIMDNDIFDVAEGLINVDKIQLKAIMNEIDRVEMALAEESRAIDSPTAGRIRTIYQERIFWKKFDDLVVLKYSRL